jgi:hypothetical protein
MVELKVKLFAQLDLQIMFSRGQRPAPGKFHNHFGTVIIREGTLSLERNLEGISVIAGSLGWSHDLETVFPL